MQPDFREHLARQLEFIQTSCDAYDAGHVYEGVRVATALRVLFHQTKKSTSLLTHLGSPAICLLSTCDVAGPHQAFFPGMTKIELHPVRGHFAYIPNLSVEYERPVPFNTWWFGEIVYLAKADNLKITRRDLVLGAANQDGGSHVDATLEPRYEKVLQGLGWSMTVRSGDGTALHISCKDGHLSALRQMGYEVLHSPDLVALVN